MSMSPRRKRGVGKAGSTWTGGAVKVEQQANRAEAKRIKIKEKQ